ncbi:MAG: hypothetical protein QM767_25145 [Anaeromyxobacter sp.]
MLGAEVDQVEDPVQANARGAGLIAAAGLGWLDLREAGARVPVRRTYAPTAAHRAVYDERYAVFVDAYRRLRGLYRRLNARPAPPEP